MKKHPLQKLVAAGACWTMIFSPVAASPLAPQAQAPMAADVALVDGGVLVGQVVDAQGAPLAQAPVTVSMQGHEVIRVAANAEGAFAVEGLKGGVYEVSTPGSKSVYRLWAPRTAPPSARQGVMVVAGPQAVRGQYGPAPGPGPFGRAIGWVAEHPFITAGVVATAIAVPLALEDDDDDSNPGS